ncbi:MAG: glycosyltransferase family 39 protein [Candidatus Omnitrophica bacterium]|nr:glycosyltransferase family 39 protein [Candidatus Omnitrophota bacterium]
MKDNSRRDFEPYDPLWDIYSAAIICFMVLVQVMQWPLFPFFVDIYYHLSVMKGFAASGGYVADAFWEYAPFGRPHIYPPLFHFILLLLYRIGLPVITIARLTNFLMPLVVLGSIWFVAKRTLGKRAAFLALLLASSVYTFYLATLTTIPAMLAMACGIFSFYFIERRRLIIASIFLAAAFYLHLLVPWVMAAALLLYGIFERKKMAGILRVLAAGIIAALPILYHQLRNIAFLSSHTVAQDWCIELNVFLCLSAAIGIIYSLRRNGPYRYFIALFLASVPFVWVHPYRYFSGEGVFVLVFLGAIGIERIMVLLKNSFHRIALISAASILFFLVSPSIMIDRGVLHFVPINSTFSNVVFGDSYYTHSLLRSIYNARRYGEIASIVDKESRKDDIIYSNNPFFAEVISVLTGRATSTGMFQEVKPFVSSDQIAVSRIILWVRDPGNLSSEPIEMIKRYKLQKIRDAELSFIYKNSGPVSKRHVRAPLIPEYIVFALMLSAILAGSVYRRIKHENKNSL